MTELRSFDPATGVETLGPDDLDQRALRDLLERAAAPVVTIAHPADRAAVDPAANDTPLKNALRDARDALTARGEDAEALLAPVERLLRHGRPHVLDGEVLYLWPGGARRHRVAHPVADRVEVGDAPLLTPLLPAVTMSGQFAVLGLERQGIRLLRATRATVAEIDLAAHGVPTGEKEVAGGDEPPEVNLRAGGRGGDPAIFHGHSDDRRDDVVVDRLFREVASGVRSLLGDGVPVVLAGVERHQAHVRRLDSGLRVAEGGVDGSPTARTPTELRDAAWPHAAAVLHQPIDDALDRFGEEAAVGRASTDLAEVVRFAGLGRVGTLIVAEGASAWGRADEAGVHELRAGDAREADDIDLVDLAVRLVLQHGGETYAVDPAELPEASPVAARLRF